jgi:hypothetical protein
VRWQGHNLVVRAWAVPRYCWLTVSIEVFLAGERILRTGGQLAAVGADTSCFDFDGTSHEVRLAWRRHEGAGFPYELMIDGEQVAVSYVAVENWWAPLMVVVAAPLLALLLTLAAFLYPF